jgi:hypothetical protein
MKVSISQAFAESLKTSFPRRKFDQAASPTKRPCSQLNSRTNKKNYSIKTNLEECNDIFIGKLVEENKRLKEELESMRKINKTLLESDQITKEQYKSFYHTVVLNHLQQKIDNLGEEANFYRIENKKTNIELENAIKDKKYMKAIAFKYKTLTEEKGSGKNSPVKPNSANSEKSRNLGSDLNSKIEDLQNFLLSLNEDQNFSKILSKLAEFLKNSIQVEKVSMILLTEEIQEIYTKSYKNTFKHYWNNMKVILAEGPFLSGLDMEYLQIEQIKAGFTSGKDLYSTITLNSEASIYICLHSKANSKKSFQLFTASDFKFFSLVSTCFSLFLNYFKSRSRELTEIEHVSNLSRMVSKLVCNKNHKELANSIFQHIPRFLEFEVAGIVFVDSGQLFIMASNSGPYEKFSDVPVKFPNDLGITGDIIKKNTVLKIENVKAHRLFNPEIDNTCRIGNLQNAIFASLIGKDKEVVGVLQVFNKTSGKNINDKDLDKVRSLQQIIGICVSSTNCISEAASLTINFRHSVQEIMHSIEHVDKSKAGADFLDVKNALNNMKSNVVEWVNQKKLKSMSLL